jgi:1-acyl-sn-glycerol-3-phosphate acyltransferase
MSYLRFFLIFVLTFIYGTGVYVRMRFHKDPTIFSRYAMSWAKKILKICNTSLSVSNPFSISLTQDFVITPNHASLMDIPILLATFPLVRIMYKKDLEKIPFFGWVLKNSPFIPVSREDNKRAYETLQETILKLQNGSSIVIFPEGTRSDDGMLGQFKRGAFFMALKANKAILPVVILGSNKLLPNKSTKLTPGKVEIHIATPIEIPQNISRSEEKELMNTVYELMNKMLERNR